MNRRKSCSGDNNSSSSSGRRGGTKRRALFVNTDKYRNKKASGDVSFDFNSPNAGAGYSSHVPKESTPVPGSSTVPKLVVHRRRGRGRQLKWPNVSETPIPHEKSKISIGKDTVVSRTGIESLSAVDTDYKSFKSEEKVNVSDILTAETVLSNHETNLSIRECTSNVAVSNETATNSLDFLGGRGSDDSLINCLLTLNDSFLKSTQKSQETAGNVKANVHGNTTNRKSDLHDDTFSNCLSQLNSVCANLDVVGSLGEHNTTKAQKCKNSFVSSLAVELPPGVLTRKGDQIPSHDQGSVPLTSSINDGGNVVKDMGLSSPSAFYGLPSHVKDLLIKHRNISALYTWQEECLKLPAVADHRNIVYSVPTSSGKTLVAEILMLREITLLEKNAMFVLPYVSIVQEKVRGLAPLAVDLNFHIEEYAASKGPIPPKKRRTKKSIYIATIEKANAIFNSLLENEQSNGLGLIVVDELHMIGEGGGRGALLEMFLAKVLFKCPWVQIVGMTATLGNTLEIQKFLKCELYTSDFRPVQLEEFVLMGDSLYTICKNRKSTKAGRKDKEEDGFLTWSKSISHPEDLDPSLAVKDPDHLASLVLDVIPHYSCLIFCATKRNCENVAAMIAKALPPHLTESKKEEKNTLLRLIQEAINGVCSVLVSTIPMGVAYHHSGLTMDERELIEEAYRAGTVSVLCCTSTLASGVNLPARRVILRSPYVGRSFMTLSQYKQMAGRAGRAGINSVGESVLIVQKKDFGKCRVLLNDPEIVCRSSLFYDDGKGVRELILSLIGLKICASADEIETFLRSTLYYIQQGVVDQKKSQAWVDEAISGLIRLGLLIKNTKESKCSSVQITFLGIAALKSSINVDIVSHVYHQLKKASEAMVLINPLHLLYLVTPLDPIAEVHVDWMIFYKQTNRFSDKDMLILQYIGISQDVLCRKATGQRVPKSSKFEEVIYKRFYLTLMIDAMLKKNKSLWDVVYEFNQSRGFLQSLFTSTLTFTFSMVHFTQYLDDMWMFNALFQTLSFRMTEARYAELAELMELPGVKYGRAMQLFRSGYKSLRDLVHVDPLSLTKKIDHLSRRQADLIVYSARMILQEKVDALREEAEEMSTLPETVLSIS